MRTALYAVCVLAGLIGLTSFGPKPGPPRPPVRTAGPIKQSDITMNRSQRFSIPAASAYVVPAGVAFVMTEASAPGGGGLCTISINGFQRTLVNNMRRFDPAIVFNPGDTVSFSGTTNMFPVTVAGFLVAPADVQGAAPTAPVPIRVADLTLDRALHFPVFSQVPPISLTVPMGGPSFAIVEWYNHSGYEALFAIDGGNVARFTLNPEGIVRFDPPIIVGPGQTLTIGDGSPASAGEIGGYVVYPGEI
jgi:hypothetical protein